MKKQSIRENFYLLSIGAVGLDLGSTIIATLRPREFAEFNPIAEAIGFYGTIVYGVVILGVISLVLLKWGVSWGSTGDKGVFLTDLIAIEVFIMGITAFLHNYGFIAVVHSYRDFYILIGVSFFFAALASFLINRQLLLH